MTNLCSVVCCRAPTYRRLINDLFQSVRHDRKNPSIGISKGKIEALVEYAATYPQKLRLVVDALDQIYLNSILRSDHGYVLLTIETFRGLVRKYHYVKLSHMLEGHVNFVLRSAIESYDPVYMKAVAKLLKDCIKVDLFTLESIEFVDAILMVCEDPGLQLISNCPGDNLVRFMGCTLLTAMIPVLRTMPNYLEANLTRIVKVLLALMRSSSSSSLSASLSLLSYELTAANLHAEVTRCSQLLTTYQTGSFVPQTLNELGWRAWYVLCSQVSAQAARRVLRTLCESCEVTLVAFSSRFFHQAVFLLCHAATTASAGPVARLGPSPGSGSASGLTPQSVSDRATAQSLGQTAGLNYFSMIPVYLLDFLHSRFKGHPTSDGSSGSPHPIRSYVIKDGSETILRDRRQRMQYLQDGVGFVALWIAGLRAHGGAAEGWSHSTLQADQLPAAVGQIVDIVAFLIKVVPSLIQYDVSVTHLIRQPCQEVAAVRSLPCSLRSPSTRRDTAQREVDTTACDLLTSLFQLVEQLSQVVAIGANFSTLLTEIVSNIGQTARDFTGSVSENLLLQHFHVCTGQVLQVLVTNLRIDYYSLAICPHGHAPMLLPDRVLVTMLGTYASTKNVEVRRHTMLTVMTLMALGRPIAEIASSDRTNGVFYPHSAQFVHRLLALVHRQVTTMGVDALPPEAKARELCHLTQMLALLFRTHGAPAALSAIPMLLSLVDSTSVPIASGVFWLLGLWAISSTLHIPTLASLISTQWSAVQGQRLVMVSNLGSSLELTVPVGATMNGVQRVIVAKTDVLRALLTCPACQALTPHTRKAFDVPFLAKQPETLLFADATDLAPVQSPADAAASGEGASPTLLVGGSPLVDDDVKSVRSDRSAHSRSSRRSVRSSRSLRSRSPSRVFLESDRYSKEALQRGFSVCMAPLLGAEGPSERRAVARHVRTEEWRRDYQHLVLQCQAEGEDLLAGALAALR